MKNHLIIGGGGFIGKHLKHYIVNELEDKVEVIEKGEKTEYEAGLYQWADRIYILAAYMGWDCPWEKLAKNESIIWHVYDMIRQCCKDGVEVVLASSQSVYMADSAYGQSKVMQEKLADGLTGFTGANSPVILRYSIVVGPGQSWDGPYQGLIRNLIACGLHGKRPVLFHDGKAVREYVSVYDVARITATCELEGVYHVRGPQDLTTLEVYDFVKGVFAEKGIALQAPVCVPEARPGDPLSLTSALDFDDCEPIWDALRDYIVEELENPTLPEPPGYVRYSKGAMHGWAGGERTT